MIELYPCLDEEENDCDDRALEKLRYANLVVLHNQIKFDQNKFGAESIIKESRIISEPLNLGFEDDKENIPTNI